jgi:hypothetical protein
LSEGKFHGLVVETNYHGTKTKRNWTCSKPDTHGEIIYALGPYYVGALCGRWQRGHGVLTMPNGSTIDRYWGTLDRILFHSNGDVEVQLGVRQNAHSGIYVSADGSRYDGQHRDGQNHGRDILTHVSGWRYEGDVSRGLGHGQGTCAWPSGSLYVGEWHHNNMHGHGIATYGDGRPYVGHWQNGDRDGMGIMTFCNGDVCEGSYRQGPRQGRSTMTYADGSRLLSTWDGVECADATLILHCAPGQTRRCTESDNPCRACAALANAQPA